MASYFQKPMGKIYFHIFEAHHDIEEYIQPFRHKKNTSFYVPIHSSKNVCKDGLKLFVLS
jgi:hypothetical protein